MKITRHGSLLLAFIWAGCMPPKAIIQADLDPHVQANQIKGSKIYIALKDETVEEKKFSYFLEQELKKNGFSITASPELSNFHLMYALNLENYKTKEFILLSNPEFVSGTLDGKNFTAQRNAYQYAPVERAHAWKEIYLDLFQKRPDKFEKIWSGMLKIENDDYRDHMQGCVSAITEAIGKDVNKKIPIK